jgi:hypothetical protein
VLSVAACLCLLASSAAALAAESVRFSITCDNRAYAGFKDVLEQMNKVPGGPGTFMVEPGDFDPPDKTRAAIDKAFGPQYGWYPVIGNHELPPAPKKPKTPKPDTSGTTAEASASSSPIDPGKPPSSEKNMQFLRGYFEKNLRGKVKPGPRGTEDTTYSFDAGPVHIVMIDLYWNGKTDPGSDVKTTVDVVEPLREWVRADLAASRKPWKLVFGHDPMFPQSDRDWETKRHTTGDMVKKEKNRDAFWKMLEEAGATAYICGHTHRYSRYQPEGSKVWQIDSAQARGGKDFKYDAFIFVTADAKTLKFETYRNLKKVGEFEMTDWLKFSPQGVEEAPEPESVDAK